MRNIALLLCSILLFAKAGAQTQQQIDNQIAFTKLYGYVRYFHPSDEAAGIDWDRFAIYGSKMVAACKDQQQLKTTLTDLFLPIAPTLQISDKKITFNKAQLIPPSLGGYKTISWQHVGVGLINDKRSPYQSARTNRNIIFEQAHLQEGAMILSGLDVKPYRGKQFRLEAKAGMVKGNGSGHFWVTVFLDNGKIGFFNNMEEDPVAKKPWQNYSITGTIDTNAINLVTGAFLSGNGEFWFDDVKLAVKEGNEWKEVYSNGFNNKKAGAFTMNNTPDPDYVFSVVADDNSPAQKWTSIKSVSKQITEKHTAYFKTYPAVGEIINKDIGSGLSAIIPLAIFGNSLNTYPIADTLKLSQLKRSYNVIKSEDISGADVYTRLAGLCITWNVFQHFFPYFDFAQTNWSDDLSEAIKSAYADKTEYDFQKTLQKLTAKLKDGHIIVKLAGDKNKYAPPIAWEWIEGKLVLTDVSEQSVPLKKGNIVTAINGVKPQDYFKNLQQFISAATPGYLNYRAQTESLLGEKDSELQLTVLNNDERTVDVSLKRTSYLQRSSPLPYGDIKILSKDVMYINIGSASMKAIDSALPQLQNSKVIICDLRGYPNNNTTFIEYLLTHKDTASNWLQTAQIIYPDRENIVAFTKEGWNFKPRKPHLNAKVIFLTDGQAISQAESYMSLIEHYKLATIIGQPTAGTNGNVNYLLLPGGYRISFTGLKVVKLDGSQHYGVGTKPDIYVNKTIKGIKEDRDEFLEKAIEVAEGLNK